MLITLSLRRELNYQNKMNLKPSPWGEGWMRGLRNYINYTYVGWVKRFFTKLIGFKALSLGRGLGEGILSIKN